MKKTAIILFNLGGPDKEEAIEPFLSNLFNDPAIIALPNPFRWLVAKIITTRRKEFAQKIYAKIGGKSPILPLTIEQKDALEIALNSENITQYKVFISMRYWHPFSHETILDVQDFNPDEVILLPLYPQFSTTTTLSSVKDWQIQAKKRHFTAKTKIVCCYSTNENFIATHTSLIMHHYWEAKKTASPRIIFSAHGLPEKVIATGDPYQWQVEETARAVVNALKIENCDWIISYQSRVGPLKWIGPSTEEEIIRAANDGVSLIIVPIAFVSEHSETLVELDIEYRKIAEEHKVVSYIRVPALGINSYFIQALKGICEKISSLETKEDISVHSCSEEKCPREFSQCLCLSFKR